MTAEIPFNTVLKHAYRGTLDAWVSNSDIPPGTFHYRGRYVRMLCKCLSIQYRDVGTRTCRGRARMDGVLVWKEDVAKVMGAEARQQNRGRGYRFGFEHIGQKAPGWKAFVNTGAVQDAICEAHYNIPKLNRPENAEYDDWKKIRDRHFKKHSDEIYKQHNEQYATQLGVYADWLDENYPEWSWLAAGCREVFNAIGKKEI